MKQLRLLLLFLLPIWATAQVSTGNEQPFDYGLQNLAPQTVANPVWLGTLGTDGTMGQTDASLWAKKIYVDNAVANAAEARVAVNDANYTITGTTNRLVAYTNITTNRNVTLPAATTANQRIWITDESSLASSSRMIIVLPNGSDLIGGATNAVVNFPNGSGYFESNGTGQWNIISTTSVQLSAGVSSLPSITDLGTGSVTLGNGVYTMFANATGVGRPKGFAITGSTFALTDQMTNYITAQYNTTTGAVSLVNTTVESTINYTTIIPVFKIYRDGTTLHIADYGSLGLALSNKLQRSWEKTQQYRFEPGGVLLGESATRIATITAGTAWKGGIEIPLTAVASNVQTCYLFTNTSGTWSKSTITQYNNTQWNDVTGLATLSGGKYGVNFVFRSVGQDTDIAIVLGTGDYSLGQAQSSIVPSNLPAFITSHMVLIGRIIVVKSATTSTQIDNYNSSGTGFSSAGITDHNALNNLQTAQTGVTYGHVTDAAQTFAGEKTFSVTSSGNTITSNQSGTGIAVRGVSQSGYSGQFISTSSTNPTLYVQNLSSGDLMSVRNLTTEVAKVDNSGNLTANSHIKTGGTSDQALMADGSINIFPPTIVITTSTSITTATTGTFSSVSYGQNGKNVIIDNGVNAINLTCNGSVTASYLKHGTGAITFVQGSGRTLVTPGGTAILNGLQGSTATISSIGTTDYLLINNL